MEITKQNFLKLPQVPGVYIFWKNNVPIYIGKSFNLKSRLNSYLDINLSTKTAQMISEAENMSYTEVYSDLESLLLESALIKKHKPKYNILLKDDKNPLYIQITKEVFPRILTSRKTGDFGPFPSATNVKTILKLIRKVFPYSDHKIGKKPCFYSHLGLCNPCPNTAINNIEYKKNIRNIKLILSRKFNVVRNSLQKEMNLLAKQEKFEDAKIVLEKIKLFDYITQEKTDTNNYLENPNLIEDLHKLEIKNLKALLNINLKLQIKNLKRIECFDIAHLAGVSATASMVVAIDGELNHSEYKHFKIKQNNRQSDYDSMREIAERRIRHLSDWGEPNLIIVDGGLGQVKIFDQVFKKINIPVVGIAKNPDRLVFADGTKIRLQGLPAGKAGQTLQLVSRLRDEAHRFARRLHHKLIAKNLLT